MVTRAIHDVFPKLRLRFERLGDFPTPVEPIGASGRAYIKRDDISSTIYGGNKVRTLEVLFADARESGSTHIVATGAFGTNHGVATVLHAPRVNLIPEVLVWPQPGSRFARDNFEVLLRAKHRLLPHWSALPMALAAAHARPRSTVMVPGGATPLGAMGYVSAGLELAQQIEARRLPAPTRIFVGVGSTCTSAGLLVGLAVAARRGIGFSQPPKVVAVRVTPWPVTSAYRIIKLAHACSQLLAYLSGDASALIDPYPLHAGLEVDGRQLGRGYGFSTPSGRRAMHWIADAIKIELDTVYSAKAAAAMQEWLRTSNDGPSLFWSTKSSVPLPKHDRDPQDILTGWARRSLRDSGS